MKLQPATWTDEIAALFVPALDGADINAFRKDVESGVCNLWQVGNCYCITQREGDVLRIWMVAGEGFVECAHAINEYLHDHSLACVVFRTRWPANLRMYGFLKPELIDPQLHEYMVLPYERT